MTPIVPQETIQDFPNPLIIHAFKCRPVDAESNWAASLSHHPRWGRGAHKGIPKESKTILVTTEVKKIPYVRICTVKSLHEESTWFVPVWSQCLRLFGIEQLHGTVLQR